MMLVAAYINLHLGSLLSDDACRAQAFGSLGDKEHALLLDRPIYVIALVCAIRKIVMCHVVDLVFLQEVGCDNPGAVWNDFVDPFAMSHTFCTLSRRQYCKTFTLVRLGVACDANYELDLWVIGRQVGEGGLGLLQRAHVTNVEEIEDPICIHSNRAVHCRRVCFEATSWVGQTGARRRLHTHCACFAVLAILDSVGGRAPGLLADTLLILFGVALLVGVPGASAFCRLSLALLLRCDLLQDRVLGALVRRVTRGWLHDIHGVLLD